MSGWGIRRGEPRAGLALRLLLALLATACGLQPVPEPGRGHPTVWRARRSGAGDVFLLGSVHLGSPGPPPLGPGFERIWQAADELVLEVDLSRYGEADGQVLMGRYGRIPTPASLKDRVSPATWELFEKYLAARALPAQALEPYQPWMVATLIAVFEFRELGYDPEHGVDRALLQRALEEGKPVVGLETLESQFAMLAGLPDPVQDLWLRDMLDRSDDFASEARAMLQAWREGRDDALARIAFRHLEDPAFAPFYENIVFERNRRMAQRVAELARDGATRLLVVGAAHMLGDRGIPALLEQQGFEVEVLE
jgi:uncharacterized protein YbaP (TraB family)